MSIAPSQTRYGCYIGNIDRSVTIDMLKQVFCQCGTIIDCSLNGREGDPYRFGFIDFATEDDRARAMKYNGFTLVGRKLKVGISKGNVNKPEGFANGNPGGSSSPGHNSDRTRQQHGYGGNSNSRSGGGDGEGGAGVNGGGLTTQQQIEARLLLQFLQEGKMDAHQLSPAQQQLLIAALGHGSAPMNSNSNMMMNNNSGSSNMLAAQPPPMMMMMGNPMAMMGGGNGMPMMPGNMNMSGGHPMMMDGMGQGGYGGPNMMALQQNQQRSPQPWGVNTLANSSSPYMAMGGNQRTPPQQPAVAQPSQQQQPFYGGSGQGVLSGGGGGVQGYGSTGAGAAAPMAGAQVNAPPSAETLRLREKQREQYFEVVRKDTEKYERKVQEKRAQAAMAGDNGDGAQRSGSSDSDEDEKPAKKSKKETSSAK